jgi:hypothetical protein
MISRHQLARNDALVRTSTGPYVDQKYSTELMISQQLSESSS